MFRLLFVLQYCISFSSGQKPAEKATMSLARVGSRAALSFAFAFLRRAWRSGEDSDLCSDLLQVKAPKSGYGYVRAKVIRLLMGHLIFQLLGE